MEHPRQVTIEGYTPDEILGLPGEQVDSFILSGEPVVFKAGSAEILAQIAADSHKLVVELAQIKGGGEGVLLTLWVLAERLALKKGLQQVEWIVYATSCADPNLKLRRLLERKGFVVKVVPDKGEAYHLIQKPKNSGQYG
jgi:hypothetical protein